MLVKDSQKVSAALAAWLALTDLTKSRPKGEFKVSLVQG